MDPLFQWNEKRTYNPNCLLHWLFFPFLENNKLWTKREMLEKDCVSCSSRPQLYFLASWSCVWYSDIWCLMYSRWLMGSSSAGWCSFINPYANKAFPVTGMTTVSLLHTTSGCQCVFARGEAGTALKCFILPQEHRQSTLEPTSAPNMQMSS